MLNEPLLRPAVATTGILDLVEEAQVDEAPIEKFAKLIGGVLEAVPSDAELLRIRTLYRKAERRCNGVCEARRQLRLAVSSFSFIMVPWARPVADVLDRGFRTQRRPTAPQEPMSL